MSNIRIEQAGIGQLEALMAWRMEVLREVFALPAGADTSGLERNNRAYYRTALADGSHLACFARIGETVVGCGGVCLYGEMPSPDNPTGRCAYLMNIYVRPAWRHRGVGRSIVAWLTGQARSRGIMKIYLETSDSGRDLYQAMGFEEMENMLKLRITDEN